MTPPFILLLLFLLIAAATTNSATTYDEVDTTLQALRNHGYTLFTNAITTSGIQFQLLANTTGDSTLFAPKDAAVFALDMASDAVSYISALRYHVIPNRRLTFSDLQNLSSPFLETLLPHYYILIGKTIDAGLISNSNRSTSVMVDGVRLSDPDLFLGSGIAVHGIDGVLVTGMNTYHSDIENGSGFISPAESPTEETASPMSEFDWTIRMAPASQSHGNFWMAPASQSHGDIWMAPASQSHGDIWMAPASQSHGDIPVEAPSQMFMGRAEKVKGLGKKKSHLRHKLRRDHRLGDL